MKERPKGLYLSSTDKLNPSKITKPKVKKPRRKIIASEKNLIRELGLNKALNMSAPVLNMSSSKIAKLMSKFVNLRSAIRQMSSSVQQVEKWLDNSYNMFQIAQLVAKNAKGKVKLAAQGDESILSNIAKTTAPAKKNFLLPLLKTINISTVLKMLQTPLVQRMLGKVLAKQQEKSIF
ncbi:MAG: hypothetical protein RLZ12_935 [Bacillota bacterium]|jgi:hypothetical protein